MVRKKYVVITPEEWVRQHLIHFLVQYKMVPLSLISVEKQIMIHTLKKRYDMVIHNSLGQPKTLIECKSPTIKINQETFYQIARYNQTLKVASFIISNGIQHFFLKNEDEKIHIYKEIPDYTNL